MSQTLRLVKILVLLFGGALLAGGAACAFLYLLLPFFYRGPDLLGTNLTFGSLAALTLSLGITLVVQTRNSLRGQPSDTFSPPSPARLALLFVFCLVVGQVMLSVAGHSAVTALAFAPFHLVAATSPALAILAFAGRRLRAASWRTVSLEVSHGALLAPLAGLAAELLVVVAVLIAIGFFVALTPGGAETLMELSRNLQDPTWTEDLDNLAPLVLSPPALAGIILVFVIAAPLLEEFLKSLGVLLLGYRLRGKTEAILWGVACGAGFALTESMFNGSIALEGWGVIMLTRCAASLMHCVAGGIMGLGWFSALTTRRPWRLLAPPSEGRGR